MSEKNKSLNPIITRVASIIYNVFDVSEKEAFEMASGKVILADGWGGKEGTQVDWQYRVRKDFGEKHAWRSEEEKKKFYEQIQTRYDAYEVMISGSRRNT
tara:strand:- start:992 stop:1291 length:300 start_codon:yes stop_codon:yes gene_type:complete